MPSTNTVDQVTAQRWVEKWRGSDEKLDLKGFWVPGDDLREVMNEGGAQDARVYMAIDDDGNYHLLIVGVDADGNDMIDPDNGQYIYDFTQPCPATCSQTGPLR